MDNILLRPKAIIGYDFLETVLPIICEAKHSIDIVVYDWRIYENNLTHPVMLLTKAITDAHQRGVEVRALVNNQGVRHYLKRQGIEAKILNTHKIVHAKMMLIDGRIAVVGSHNYTQGGLTMNLEISILCDFCTVDNGLSEYFNQLWPL